MIRIAIVEDEEVIEYIEGNSQIQVVQKIGHVLVLFKQADKRENRSYSLEAAKM